MKDNDIKLFDLLLHIPNYMSKRDCDTLIKYYQKNETKNGSFYEASMTPDGEHKQSSFTCIEICDPNSIELQLLKYSVHDIIKKYNDYLKTFTSFHTTSLKFGSYNYVHKYRILKYSEGASIHPHSDHSPYGYGSCTINLNEDYEGGAFSFFNGKHEINLKRGDAIIFPADHFWVHEVKPIISGERFSFNSFLNKIPENIMMNLNYLADNFVCLPQHPHYVGPDLINMSSHIVQETQKVETQKVETQKVVNSPIPRTIVEYT
jgi:predicted 2-oxoglutarate/Fe(II)-dependent dioxygenase YbiX